MASSEAGRALSLGGTGLCAADPAANSNPTTSETQSVFRDDAAHYVLLMKPI